MECLFDNNYKKKFLGEVPFCRNVNYKLVFLQLYHKGKLKVEKKLVCLQLKKLVS